MTMTSNRRAVIESVAAVVVGYIFAAELEAAVIRWVRPTELELAWLSDVVLALALGVAVYLWRHLLTTRHELEKHERAELVLGTELALAADIQRRLLPRLPPPDNGFEWAAELRSAGKIGGDFYDFVEIAANVWTVLVADVSGKGIPAAMALGSLRAAFRTLARQRLPPAQMMAQLSADLMHEWRGVPYVTCIIVTFDLQARTLTYTNAGHPPGILVRSGRTRYLDRGGPPAGLLPNALFEQQSVSLYTGDTCVLVSDGVTEALDDRPPLEKLVGSMASSGSAAELCGAVMAQALDGHGPLADEQWDDDRTVVVVRVRDAAVGVASVGRASAEVSVKDSRGNERFALEHSANRRQQIRDEAILDHEPNVTERH
jgi:serine phosphatase RsbU (regulator of sigma subunit)